MYNPSHGQSLQGAFANALGVGESAVYFQPRLGYCPNLYTSGGESS